MTPQQIEAMKLALECAERCEAIDGMYSWSATITVLEKVLAEHAMRETQRLGQEIEQQPVVYQCPRCATSMQVDLTAKAALAQMEQEPVELCQYGQEPESCTSSPMDCQCAIDAALAQPEQEPVAWMDADGNVSDNNDHKCFPIPLYTKEQP